MNPPPGASIPHIEASSRCAGRRLHSLTREQTWQEPAPFRLSRRQLLSTSGRFHDEEPTLRLSRQQLFLLETLFASNAYLRPRQRLSRTARCTHFAVGRLVYCYPLPRKSRLFRPFYPSTSLRSGPESPPRRRPPVPQQALRRLRSTSESTSCQRLLVCPQSRPRGAGPRPYD